MKLKNISPSATACAFLMLSGLSASAQDELQEIQKRSATGVIEEFSVFKADKTMRQGAYVKYRPAGPLNGVIIFETGSYDHGQKDGEWRTFSEIFPWNKLRVKGTYRAGIQEGQWIYYHANFSPGASKRAVAINSEKPKSNFAVDVEDTTAVVQAKGFCHKGARVGLWKYYDETSTMAQAINHSSNQVVYWQQASAQPVTGEATAKNHPLLYVGGKRQLKWDIANGIDLKQIILSGQSMVKAWGQSSLELVFMVDSTGNQTSMSVTHAAPFSKYERFIVSEVSKLALRWQPQVVEGAGVTAAYHVTVVAEKPNERGIILTVNPLGD